MMKRRQIPFGIVVDMQAPGGGGKGAFDSGGDFLQFGRRGVE